MAAYEAAFHGYDADGTTDDESVTEAMMGRTRVLEELGRLRDPLDVYNAAIIIRFENTVGTSQREAVARALQQLHEGLGHSAE